MEASVSFSRETKSLIERASKVISESREARKRLHNTIVEARHIRDKLRANTGGGVARCDL